MSFPSSPINNQRAVVNSITYIYSTTAQAWTRVVLPAVSVEGTSSTFVITNASPSTSPTTGALRVTGGAGIGGALNIASTSYIDGAQIITTATIGTYAASSSAETTGTFFINNATTSTGTTTGALVVVGGVGIGGDLNIGGGLTAISSGTVDVSVMFGASNSQGKTVALTLGNTSGSNPPTTTTINFGTWGGTGGGTGANITYTNLKEFSIKANGPGTTITMVTTMGTAISIPANTINTTFAGIATIKSTAVSASTTSGALIVTGGVGIGGDLRLGGTLYATVGTATTATNIAGGAAGDLLYQSASGVTSKISIGSAGKVLQSNGAVAAWTGDFVPQIAGVTGSSSSGTCQIPAGDASGRPDVGVEGMFRYNTFTKLFEGFIVDKWTSLITGDSQLQPSTKGEEIRKSPTTLGLPGYAEWIVPAVSPFSTATQTSVSMVCVGGGGGAGDQRAGGGGALAWINLVPVLSGQVYRIYVGAGGNAGGADGGTSKVSRMDGGNEVIILQATGGKGSTNGGTGGTFSGQGGGNGGPGGYGTYAASGSGGGGAGGYGFAGTPGNGGAGGSRFNAALQANGTNGTLGAGAGGMFASSSNWGGGGGGVELKGRGSDGIANSGASTQGGGGSGGLGNQVTANGGFLGGGGGGSTTPALRGTGADGGVRIVWGPSVAFPDNAA